MLGSAQAALANPAWREQCVAIAVLAPLAAVLNWITTGDHLLRTLTAFVGQVGVAGDLTQGIANMPGQHLLLGEPPSPECR